MTTTQRGPRRPDTLEWCMIAVLVLAVTVIVAFAWVATHQRDDYQDACVAAGGVAVKASTVGRICIDRDAVLDVPSS